MPILDDRSISGNPYDPNRWQIVRRGDVWAVLDGAGHLIAEKPTKAEAEAWVEEARRRQRDAEAGR